MHGYLPDQWKCRKGCGICNSFQAEDESLMVHGCKKDTLLWYIFARVKYVELKRWLLLLYERSSYKEDTDFSSVSNGIGKKVIGFNYCKVAS